MIYKPYYYLFLDYIIYISRFGGGNMNMECFCCVYIKTYEAGAAWPIRLDLCPVCMRKHLVMVK